MVAWPVLLAGRVPGGPARAHLPVLGGVAAGAEVPAAGLDRVLFQSRRGNPYAEFK